MKDWKQLELAVFATQLYDKHFFRDGRDVRYDVEIPNPDGNPRQIDVAVYGADGTALRMFEVQDRTTPVGLPDLGQFIDKMNEVGADELTTVTRAGYWKSAAQRVEREHRVVALELREPCDQQPFAGLVSMSIGYNLGAANGPAVPVLLDVDAHTAQLVETSSGEHLLDFAYGTVFNEEWQFFAVLCARAGEWVGLTVLGLAGPHDHSTNQPAPLTLYYEDGTSVAYPPSERLERSDL